MVSCRLNFGSGGLCVASETKMEIRGMFRATSHLPIWEVLEQAGIFAEVGLELADFSFCNEPAIAEAALLDGKIDFVSGNHISTYTEFGRHGKPIVHLTSPSNSVNYPVVAREPITGIGDLQGTRIGEVYEVDMKRGVSHIEGNHALYLRHAGVEPDQVTWVALGDLPSDEFKQAQLEALKDGRIDATFVQGGTRMFEEAGFHVHRPGPMPMINGPTMTCASPNLRKREGLGERLVKAQVLAIHYGKTKREETNRILEGLAKRRGDARVQTAERFDRMPRKPYPDLRAVANAWEMAYLQDPETEQTSPMALWDLHYLRELDDSGFIDQLYS
jgi:ABC-type nitrate/sulfonate/bicarbonate transport system substrate-binding protein